MCVSGAKYSHRTVNKFTTHERPTNIFQRIWQVNEFL